MMQWQRLLRMDPGPQIIAHRGVITRVAVRVLTPPTAGKRSALLVQLPVVLSLILAVSIAAPPGPAASTIVRAIIDIGIVGTTALPGRRPTDPAATAVPRPVCVIAGAAAPPAAAIGCPTSAIAGAMRMTPPLPSSAAAAAPSAPGIPMHCNIGTPF